MATTTDVVQFVRTNVRDFAQLFSAERDGDGIATVFDMPFVCIDKDTLKVTLQTATPLPLIQNVDYILDDRGGSVQLLTYTPLLEQDIFFEGQHFTWMVNEDIEYFAQTVIGRFETDPNYVFADTVVGTPRFEVIGVATIIEAFWSILAETALDIDLRNPEGIDLAISQRFSQIQQIIDRFDARYSELVEDLNIGLGRIEMFTLRRVSMMTGRLVPVYIEQEIGDQTAPVQIFPPIDRGSTS